MPENNWTAIATIILAIATAFNGWALYITSRARNPKPKAKAKTKAEGNVAVRAYFAVGLWGFRHRSPIVLGTVVLCAGLIVRTLSASITVTRKMLIDVIVLSLLSAFQVATLILAYIMEGIYADINQLKTKQATKSRSVQH